MDTIWHRMSTIAVADRYASDYRCSGDDCDIVLHTWAPPCATRENKTCRMNKGGGQHCFSA